MGGKEGKFLWIYAIYIYIYTYGCYVYIHVSTAAPGMTDLTKASYPA